MAAAVFIPPSPHDPFTKMTTAVRRAPLASIPNATNSPHRILTNSGSKRSRAQANVSHQENEPPLKRQAIEKSIAEPSPTAARRHQRGNPEGRVFDRGNGESGSTAFQRRLVAARERNTGLRITKNVEQTSKDESIRAWQKHYRKLFPTFSFYFDSVGDEVRARFVRHITALGAKEEKFFSKSVTHIITTRPIPSEPEQGRSTDISGTQSTISDDQPTTINPSLLDKNSTFNPALRNQPGHLIRKDGSNNLDILSRGKQMGMKIWAAEKLHRVISSILEDAVSQNHNIRPTTQDRRGHQEDLSQVLRNERLAASSERDQTHVLRDLIPFKGPFIYIHDIDEKVRPTMVRDYPKVARRQDGEWPQFRSASVGKCPFLEDPVMKKEMEQDRVKQKSVQREQPTHQEMQSIPRTRSTTNLSAVAMDPPRKDASRKALGEVSNPPVTGTINPILLNKGNSEVQPCFPPMPDRQFEFVRPGQLQLAREPAASGIQRSNLTSAIQSQMISSTAATGIKAGTSREVHELKRKVFERTHTGSLSNGSIPSSHRMTDLTGALKNVRGPAPQRAAKSKAQEKLGGITEEDDVYADEAMAERAAQAAAKRKKALKRDPKPGYCENCRDKYEDFEEHITSRKHRKFATTDSNWTELDALLSKLQDS